MELILEILSNPTVTFQKLKANGKISRSLLIFISGWFNFLLSLCLYMKVTLSLSDFVLIFTASSLILVFLLSLKTMWIHFVSELFGSEGRVKGFLSVIGYSTLPFHFSLPVTLIGQITFPSLIVPAWIGLLFWSSALGFNAFKENYKLSKAKSTLVALSPVLLSFAFLIFLIALALAIFSIGFFSIFSKISSPI